MTNTSLTPAEFDRAMEKVVALRHRHEVSDAGFKLIQDVLGDGMPAYLPALDQFCRRLRQLKPRKQYGAPTTASIAAAQSGPEVEAL